MGRVLNGEVAAAACLCKTLGRVPCPSEDDPMRPTGPRVACSMDGNDRGPGTMSVKGTESLGGEVSSGESIESWAEAVVGE